MPSKSSAESDVKASSEASNAGATKMASLTNCCSGTAANSENSNGETKPLRPKITRRKTKSSVGVDGELKKEVSARGLNILPRC